LKFFGGNKMKKLLLVLALLAISSAAQAAMVAQWSFENNLTDTATGGTAADDLVGMAMYPPNGQYAPTAYQNAPVYQANAGIIGGGSAVRIGSHGTYTYLEGHEDHYPWADGYNPLTITGASYLTTTADSVDLDLQSGAFTLEGFFKADAIGGQGGLGEFAYTRLLTKWVGGGFTQNYHFTIHSGKLELIQKNSMGGAVTVASTSAVAPVANKWFYVAAVGNGDDTISLYFYVKDINGNVIGGLVGTGAYDGSMYNSTSPFWVGGREDIYNPITDNNGFIGLADEVRIWDEAKDTTYLAARAAMIPEPATMAILALGGLLLRRKK
jgi:hypothetical protein